MKRLSIIAQHLEPTHAAGPKSDDDVVIVWGKRTPFAKAYRGSFKDKTAAQLLLPLFKEMLKDTQINPELITDVQIGKVRGDSGKGARDVRIAALEAGLHVKTACSTCNRQCSSGLQSIAHVAAAISSGHIQIGVAGGVESMSTGGRPSRQQEVDECIPGTLQSQEGCYWSMGQTSEEVARRYNVSRETQDMHGLRSHTRALESKEFLRGEIVPCYGLDHDQGPRASTLEGLAKLRPAFGDEGKSTAGNSSQVTDGAAIVLMMKRSRARELGYTPIGRFVHFSVVGVEPKVMGIGPAYAVPRLLKDTNLRIEDISLFEINEAFASQYDMTLNHLNISPDIVNIHGGAIAVGHPLGASGARMTITLLRSLSKGQYGIVTMCCGTGFGAAGLFQRE